MNEEGEMSQLGQQLRLPRADNARVTEIKSPEDWGRVIPFKLQRDPLGLEAHGRAAEAQAQAERSIAAYLRDDEKWSAEARRQELRWKLITRLIELSPV
jgi:hypothetical protein